MTTAVYKRIAVPILQGLADGKYQEEIAEELHYSRPRISQCITQLKRDYKARTNIHLVAEALRRGVIK